MNSNNAVNNALNYLSTKLNNPLENLSPEQITQIQTLLEQIKVGKLKKIEATQKTQFPQNRANDLYDPMDRGVPVDWRNFSQTNQYNFNQPGQFPQQAQQMQQMQHTQQAQQTPGSRGSAYTRSGKRSQQVLPQNNSYFNPYEYGSKQNILPPTFQEKINGPYNNDPVILNHMGVQNDGCGQNATGIRNINIESLLQQRETTHLPGQREITEREINRFELLPFDPQDTGHIVWNDGMPRGGYATRSDRLEL